MEDRRYSSITVWQGQLEWLLDVVVSGFDTAESAADFGNHKVKKLVHEENAEYLTLVAVDGRSYIVEQEEVVVYKIKSESRDKIGLNEDDFTVVDVQIKDFSKTEGLNRGFGSLAYAVRPCL